MPALWFYGRDETKLGPFSAVEMKALASSGGVLPEDTVWQEGVERGVPARKVKNLFAPLPDTLPTVGHARVEPPRDSAVATVAQTVGAAKAAGALPLAEVKSEKAAAWREAPARKGRATACRGAVIVGQDGISVKFRKKCTTCGHQGSSWQTVPIRAGMMKSTYYCPKCKKTRDVEVVGTLHY